MQLKRHALVMALATVFSVVAAQAANAAVILTFGQNSGTNTITATNNGAGATTITGTNVAVTITQIDAVGIAPVVATLNFNATSTGAAANNAGNATQPYQGTFSITNGATNYLSGTFSDSVFGSIGGTSLTLSVAQPPDTVSFTSNVIAPGELGLARGMSLSFVNLTPAVSISNASLGSFTASIGGNFSANVGQTSTVPEPTSLILLGSGLVGVASRLRRRSRKA